MSFDLRQGFRLGPWKIEPLRGAITGSDGQTQHLEPKVMDVFVCLTERANELVTRDELLDAVWNEHNAADELLTGAISDLRHALQDDRNNPQYIETVPKRGYRLAGQVLPLAESGSKKRVFRQRTLWAAGGALVATLAVLVGLNVGWLGERPSGGTPSGPVTSIAVLPFVSLSSGEDDGYFADGLTEEILNALTQLPELQVTARTSTFFYKGQNIPVSEIAARLNVAHVVEGSVRREGDRLRITAQLVRASDDVQLWSQTYNRTLDDVFAVQEDIAENIVSTLDVVLDDTARQFMRGAGIRDVDAFIAYQKGLKAYADAHSGPGSVIESLITANEYFDRALEAAPGLTAARLLRTDRMDHINLAFGRGRREEKYSGEAQDNLAAFLEELDTARRLSVPGNQRDILDLERTLLSEDWSNLPKLIPRALQPGGCVKMIMALELLPPFGWAEELAAKLRDMLACDPMDRDNNEYLPLALIWAGDLEAAIQALNEAEDRGLNDPAIEEAIIDALHSAGRVEDTIVTGPLPSRWRELQKIKNEALAGDPVLARQMVEDFWVRSDVHDFLAISLAVWVGDREGANKFASRIDARTGGVAVLLQKVFFCLCGAPFDLEATPNFKARIEKANLPWPPPKPIDYPAKTW